VSDRPAAHLRQSRPQLLDLWRHAMAADDERGHLVGDERHDAHPNDVGAPPISWARTDSIAVEQPPHGPVTRSAVSVGAVGHSPSDRIPTALDSVYVASRHRVIGAAAFRR